MTQEITRSPEGNLIDFIVQGEGETAFNRLVETQDGREACHDIPSLTYKDGDEFITNPMGELQDLSQLKPPIRDKRRLAFIVDDNLVLDTDRVIRLCDAIIKNYRFLKDIHADAAYCQILTPHPKIGMREQLMTQGLVTNALDLKKYNGLWGQCQNPSPKCRQATIPVLVSSPDSSGMVGPVGQGPRNREAMDKHLDIYVQTIAVAAACQGP